jgi:hypothetical protein
VSESHKDRVIRMSRERKDFVAGDDGYWVYWPTGRSVGAVGAAELRILADELDRLNADWDRAVNEFVVRADDPSRRFVR